MPADWSIRSTANLKPTVRFAPPNAEFGNPNSHFGKPNTCFGMPAFLFGFSRNACSSSSENLVRLQPKILFGFAEIRSRRREANSCGWLVMGLMSIPLGCIDGNDFPQ